jgi:hypothetical protein
VEPLSPPLKLIPAGPAARNYLNATVRHPLIETSSFNRGYQVMKTRPPGEEWQTTSVYAIVRNSTITQTADIIAVVILTASEADSTVLLVIAIREADSANHNIFAQLLTFISARTHPDASTNWHQHLCRERIVRSRLTIVLRQPS